MFLWPPSVIQLIYKTLRWPVFCKKLLKTRGFLASLLKDWLFSTSAQILSPGNRTFPQFIHKRIFEIADFSLTEKMAFSTSPVDLMQTFHSKSFYE